MRLDVDYIDPTLLRAEARMNTVQLKRRIDNRLAS